MNMELNGALYRKDLFSPKKLLIDLIQQSFHSLLIALANFQARLAAFDPFC